MNRKNRLYKEWHLFIFLLLLMSVFRSAVADWYTVPTGSMKPTIIEGDRIYVNKMAYGLRVPFTNIAVTRWSSPQRGDVVVFASTAANMRLVKRVIGIPGDVIELLANQLYVNGKPATYRQSQINSESIGWGLQTRPPLLLSEQMAATRHDIAVSTTDSYFTSVTVPANHLFVLGDNRDNSADSRYIGFVPIKEVLGKALGVIVSLDSNHYYLPRSGRYLQSMDRDS